MLDELIAGLDPHDAALGAAALRRQGAAVLADVPGLHFTLVRALERRANTDPDPGAGAPVTILEEVRAARGRVEVEGQGSPYRPVRSLCESPHYLKEARRGS